MSFGILASGSASAVWVKMIQSALAFGEEISPRGKPVSALFNTHLGIHMDCPIVAIPQRNLSYKFMFAEAYWILSGSNKVEDIAPYCKKISYFSDDGKTFFGAYGPRFVKQVDHIVDTLIIDPDSRQAVMTIWRENPPDTKDVPCTVSIQFLINKNFLNMIVTMRSSDVWLGLPYDMFNFIMMATIVATRLKTVELGMLFMNIGNQHLYHDNREAALELLDGFTQLPIPYHSLDHIGSPSHLMDQLRAARDNLIDQVTIPMFEYVCKTFRQK